MFDFKPHFRHGEFFLILLRINTSLHLVLHAKKKSSWDDVKLRLFLESLSHEKKKSSWFKLRLFLESLSHENVRHV